METYTTKDTYVKKLEMDIKFLNSQISSLINEKSELQSMNEDVQHSLLNLREKLYQEINEKYKKEIEEKDFIIKSLKRDFEVYMQLDGDSEQKSNLRKSHKKMLKKLVRIICLFNYCVHSFLYFFLITS